METSLQKETKFTPEQEAFIFDSENKSTVLIATAGSGKTYCCVEKLKEFLSRGVDPKRIIFFSFTTAAVEELKNRVNNDDIKITTIHSFCVGLLAKMGKFKKIASFYDFINWFKEKHKPKPGTIEKDKTAFFNLITELYEDAEYHGSAISAFKLQNAEGIKSRIPDFYKEYIAFQKETRSRDFSDMLIEVRDLLKDNKWLRMFRNKYDYIFVDEYQDTSTIQMEILLSLNAKYYYIIGDRNQSIYSYSGANCDAVESMLKRRRDTKEMTLSTNFRSAKTIVENANLYSSLNAVPFHKKEGKVHKKIILFEQLVGLMNLHKEIVILGRTNSVIKEIEKRMLIKKIPMRYFNFITPVDIKELKKGENIRPATKNKLDSVLPAYGTLDKLIEFIEDNQESKSFVTSIHKSKGREFEVCVVVNSLSPEVLKYNNLILDKDSIKAISFDPDDLEDFESKNVHYVAISRAKSELFFMVLEA
jgi:superfamily I DNA/RNA helicase